MGMARTWEGKDKAFIKFGLKEAPHQVKTPCKKWYLLFLWCSRHHSCTGNRCNVQENITKTCLEHCQSKLSCQSALTWKEWGTRDYRWDTQLNPRQPRVECLVAGSTGCQEVWPRCRLAAWLKARSQPNGSTHSSGIKPALTSVRACDLT